MNHYFLKRYIPIFLADNQICIGIPQTDIYLEIKNKEKNFIEIEHLIKYGIKEPELQASDNYKKLFKKGTLEQTKEHIKLSRNKLFFDYLTIPFLDSEQLQKKY